MRKFVELLEKCEVEEEFYLNNKRKETRESVVHKYCGNLLVQAWMCWKKIFQPNNLKQVLSGFKKKRHVVKLLRSANRTKPDFCRRSFIRTGFNQRHILVKMAVEATSEKYRDATAQQQLATSTIKAKTFRRTANPVTRQLF